MAESFIGRYEHSLDAKGRLILPAKFRPIFKSDGRAYLSQYHDQCLALWTHDEFVIRMSLMQERAELGPSERNLARVWAAGCAELKVDAQGRVPIPAHLRNFARLGSEVLVSGAINRIELWNPALWQRWVIPEERQFTGPASQGTHSDESEWPLD